MKVFKRFLVLVVCLLAVISGGSSKAQATNHGYCYEGDYGYKYYVNYDKTDLLECHGGKDIIYKWVAESELIIKFRTGMEYGRYKVYIKKVNDKFYYSERDMLHWIEVEPNISYYLPFCNKVEGYIMLNNEEEIKK